MSRTNQKQFLVHAMARLTTKTVIYHKDTSLKPLFTDLNAHFGMCNFLILISGHVLRIVKWFPAVVGMNYFERMQASSTNWTVSVETRKPGLMKTLPLCSVSHHCHTTFYIITVTFSFSPVWLEWGTCDCSREWHGAKKLTPEPHRN